MSVTQNKNIKVYFENLNSIRFIAASLVIVHHIEQFKVFFHLPNYWDNKVIFIIGKLGVILFFVLSGFLISYLLFKENEVTNTINVKKFYIRRILRIWPLYFNIVLAAFFIFPFVDFFSLPGFGKDFVWSDITYKLILFTAFLPNLVLHVYGMIPYASHTWSIGGEEQFYLVWPVLNKKIKSKWILMFLVLFTYLLIKGFLSYLSIYRDTHIIMEFWKSIPIDCMAIGGIFALIAYENKPMVNKLQFFLFTKIVQWTVLLLTIYLMAIGFKFRHFHYEFYAVLFGILIVNFACNKDRIFSMENALFNYLGKISYGLYMFHPIAIVLSIKLIQILGFQTNYILYPLVFILIIILSTLSYEFFEKIFIKKKIKYSDIISGDNSKK
jgi:peptidoglycan/LPS O-acetylase OafA/YrhL